MMDSVYICDYCTKNFETISITLPCCGYLICYEHLKSNDTNQIDCYNCKDTKINIKQTFEMLKNRLKIRDYELKMKQIELNHNLDEFLSIKNDIKTFVDLNFNYIIKKIDQRKQDLTEQIHTYYTDLINKLKLEQEQCELDLIYKLDNFHLPQLDLNLSLIKQECSNQSDKLNTLNLIDAKLKEIEAFNANLDTFVKANFDFTKDYDFQMIKCDQIDMKNIFGVLKLKNDQNKTIVKQINQLITDMISPKKSNNTTTLPSLMEQNCGIKYIKDESIRLWNKQNVKCIKTFDMHNGSVYCIKPFESRDEFVSGSVDKTIMLWSLIDGRCIKTIRGHRDWVRCIELDEIRNHVISGCMDNVIKLWDLNNGRCLKTFFGHTGAIYDVKLLNAGQIVSGSTDYTIKLWDQTSGICLETLHGHKSIVNCLRVFKSSTDIVSGSSDRNLKIWDTNSGRFIHTLVGHEEVVSSLDLFDCGDIVSGSYDKMIKIWDKTSGKCVQTLEGHDGVVRCIKVLNTGEIISCSSDKSIKIWDRSTGKCMKTIEVHDKGILCLDLLQNGDIISGSADKIIKIFR